MDWGGSDFWAIFPTLGIEFSFETGLIEVTVDRLSGESVVDLLHGTNLRFVIIYPPSTEMIKDVDLEDYDAVMDALEHY